MLICIFVLLSAVYEIFLILFGTVNTIDFGLFSTSSLLTQVKH